MYTASLRTYDPKVGRFISEDPLPTENLYAYSSNSPLLLSDATGLAARGSGYSLLCSDAISHNSPRRATPCRPLAWD